MKNTSAEHKHSWLGENRRRCPVLPSLASWGPCFCLPPKTPRREVPEQTSLWGALGARTAGAPLREGCSSPQPFRHPVARPSQDRLHRHNRGDGRLRHGMGTSTGAGFPPAAHTSSVPWPAHHDHGTEHAQQQAAGPNVHPRGCQQHNTQNQLLLCFIYW